ncbi:MAG: 3(2),5-bisphosphate nucleotidase CysQ, partial [Pseudomonadota bacterium]
METSKHDSAEAQLALAFAQAAVSAGALIMDVYRRDFRMRMKSDSSPVCEADERSEELILQELAKACPGVPVVAEESVSKGHVPQLERSFLLVDPLDGTREFANRNGEFT